MAGQLLAWTVWAGKCWLVGKTCSLAASYVKSTAAKTAPGAPRLAKWWPVLLLFTALPLVFSPSTETLSRACCTAVLLWLANFKLLLLALNRGPLTDLSLTQGQFNALLLSPVLHKEGPGGAPERLQLPHRPDLDPALLDRAYRNTMGLKRAVWRLPENLIILVVAGYMLNSSHVPVFIKTYAGAFGFSSFAALWCNLCAALAIWRHGLEMAPTWDRPWLQNSLTDFWSRRWNLAAAYTLRSLIFEPIMEGRAVRKIEKSEASDSGAALAAANGTAAARSDAPHGTIPASADTPAGAAAAARAIAPAGEEGSDAAAAATPTAGKSYAKAAADGAATENGKAHEAGANGHVGPVDSNGTVDAKKPGLDAEQPAAAGTGATAAGGIKPRGRGPRVSAGRRLLALVCTFGTSGLMHEVMLLVCTGYAAYRPRAGCMMIYFLLQVPASIVEQQMARAFKRAKWTPPDVLAIPFTSLSLQIPGLFFFWRPIFQSANAAMYH